MFQKREQQICKIYAQIRRKKQSSQAFECVKFKISGDPSFRIDEFPIKFSNHIVYKILNFK